MSKEKRSKRLGRALCAVCTGQHAQRGGRRHRLPSLVLVSVATHANLTFPLLHSKCLRVSQCSCVRAVLLLVDGGDAQAAARPAHEMLKQKKMCCEYVQVSSTGRIWAPLCIRSSGSGGSNATKGIGAAPFDQMFAKVESPVTWLGIIGGGQVGFTLMHAATGCAGRCRRRRHIGAAAPAAPLPARQQRHLQPGSEPRDRAPRLAAGCPPAPPRRRRPQPPALPCGLQARGGAQRSRTVSPCFKANKIRKAGPRSCLLGATHAVQIELPATQPTPTHTMCSCFAAHSLTEQEGAQAEAEGGGNDEPQVESHHHKHQHVLQEHHGGEKGARRVAHQLQAGRQAGRQKGGQAVSPQQAVAGCAWRAGKCGAVVVQWGRAVWGASRQATDSVVVGRLCGPGTQCAGKQAACSVHALASCRVMKGSWPPLAPPPGPDRAPMLERSMGALLVVLLRRGSLASMLLRAPPPPLPLLG